MFNCQGPSALPRACSFVGFEFRNSVLDFNDGNGVNFKWKVLVEQNAHSIITYDYNIYCNIMLYIYICMYIYIPRLVMQFLETIKKLVIGYMYQWKILNKATQRVILGLTS